MKKYCCFLFIFLFSFNYLQAQTKVLDSLKKEVASVNNVEEKVRLYNAISNEYKFSDGEKMLEFGLKALDLSQKNEIKIETANAYLNIGTAHIILGSYDDAIENFVWAKSTFEGITVTKNNRTEVVKGIAKTYGYMGIVLSEQSNYSGALQYYLKSAKRYETLQDEVQLSKIFNNIGVAYKSQNQTEKALQYFLKAESLQKKWNDPNIGITLNNIANLYLKQQKMDVAFTYYTLAKNSIDQHPNKRALGEWHNTIGEYYIQRNQPQLALENWEKAIVTFEELNDTFGLTDTYLHLGDYYLRQNNFQEALERSTKALAMAQEINVLEQQGIAEKLISDIYTRSNKPVLALTHFKRYSAIKDSITKENDIRKEVEAAMNYEYEKKELMQKEESQKRELLLREEAKNANLKLIFFALITILLFGIGFLIYNRAQLKKNLTLQKELAEYEQKALHLQMNPHFVFNCLGSISSFIVQNGTDSAIKYLSKFSKLMRLTLEYSKESLIPIDREIESLRNYLELEQLRFNDKFSFTITKSAEIDDDVALPPLLIQPFIENAIIHGVIPKQGTGTIQIDFYLEDNSLFCAITDNGVGIYQSKRKKQDLVQAHKSMALDIIKKRLEMIAEHTSKSATIGVEELMEGTEVSGTKVVVQLPLQYVAEKKTYIENKA